MDRRTFLQASGAVAAMAGVAPMARSSESAITIDDKQLQAVLEDAVQALDIVGGQLAVFDGEQIHEYSTGFANRELQLPVTADTLFQIGSTTKVFNAAVVMALVDDGVLDLDAPVKTWIEDFALPSAAAEESVNLRQLMSMSAGIDNGPYEDHGRGDDALGRYVAAMAEVPMIFEPGTAFGYSNACTNIAGLAAERATGKSWEMLLAEKILVPLSLLRSATFPEDLLFHSLALGYSRDPDSAEPNRVPFWGLPRSMAPAGATLCCSAGDLVRFASLFLRDGRNADGDVVLSEAGVQAMHTPQIDLPNRVMAHKWCPGPYYKVWDGAEIYGHSGTNTGGSSMLLWCPEKNFAVATISNVARQGYPLADRVFATVFPELFGIQKPKTPTPADVERASVDLAPFTGQFESLNNRYVFSEEDGRLMARAYLGDATDEPTMSSELIPLGGNRFLPAELAMSGNRNWDVAFWGDDGGRATHYLNGVFAMRRTG